MPESDFGADRYRNDGLKSRCRRCCNATAGAIYRRTHPQARPYQITTTITNGTHCRQCGKRLNSYQIEVGLRCNCEDRELARQVDREIEEATAMWAAEIQREVTHDDRTFAQTAV